MANWKSILGLGAACAACCAVPLAGALGVMGVMGAGGVLAAAGAALLACADELALAFGILGALALAFMYWRRRKVTNAALPACTYPAATPCAPGTPCQGCQTRQTT
jgi:hypothetical protein